MSKLKLKRTAAEEREHALRKARRAAKRASKSAAAGSSSSRDYPLLFDLPEDAPLPDPYDDLHASGSSRTSDSAHAQALRDSEEMRRREKLEDVWAGADDDHWGARDALEAEMNSYSHIPKRWRDGSMRYTEAPEESGGRVEDMDDEAYAEWIREGMWKRTHRAEHEAREAERAAQSARKREARERTAETRRLAREQDTGREQRRVERQLRAAELARSAYEARWAALAAGTGGASSGPAHADLAFADVPWPVLPASAGAPVCLADLTPEALARFLLPPPDADADAAEQEDARKRRLREAMLRYHPDKFEVRVLGRVREDAREEVKEGVGRVVRGVTELMRTT